jgi:hypothetical protein
MNKRSYALSLRKGRMRRGKTLERVGDVADTILEKWRTRAAHPQPHDTSSAAGEEDLGYHEGTALSFDGEGDGEEEILPFDIPDDRYDFDLAEFPLFRFEKPRLNKHDTTQPLCYTDTIVGKKGELITREWKLRAPYGFGGASTQSLFYDLLQLYIEQGAKGRYIHFGTLRALFLRQGNRNPSKRDYERMKRDIDILRGYDFHAKNAFWSSRHQAYVDMKWRLFDNVFYVDEKPESQQSACPLGVIEINSVLQRIAQTRGFFALGFGSKFFHGLKPLEQRLAIYLAKKFRSQTVHRRFADELAKALPTEASQPNDVRKAIRRAACGLLEKNFSLLASFSFEKSRDGRYLAVFQRKARPTQEHPLPLAAAETLAPEMEFLVSRILEASGDEKSRYWWIQCARSVGQGGVDRALGQFRETCQIRKVKNRGAMLTKIFIDIAKEHGVTIH